MRFSSSEPLSFLRAIYRSLLNLNSESKPVVKDDGIFRIRAVEPKDIPLVLHFIKRIAEYEKLADEVEATEESLMESFFGPNHVAHVRHFFFFPPFTVPASRHLRLLFSHSLI